MMSLYYVTTKDKTEARELAQILLHKKLIACANIIDGMESIYHWKEKVETSNECVLLLKSLKDNFSKIESILKEVHSYDCPCLIEIPTGKIGSDYEKWFFNQFL